MKKYIVTGYTRVTVEVTVEAENEEEAIEKAYDNIGIDSFCDTDEATASIYSDSELEYEEVEEIN